MCLISASCVLGRYLYSSHYFTKVLLPEYGFRLLCQSLLASKTPFTLTKTYCSALPKCQNNNIRSFLWVDPRLQCSYLEGLPRELASAELTLDLAFGAVVLQVLRQVTARQLDGTAVGAGDHVEGAGGEMTLREQNIEQVSASTHAFFRPNTRTHSHAHAVTLHCGIKDRDTGGGEQKHI